MAACLSPWRAGILVLFCLYLGLYHALFGALLAMARMRHGRQTALLLSPWLWVAVELARARVTGFPWDLLGVAQIDHPVLTRLAPIGGAYALSFVIALVNALWLLRFRVQDRRYVRPLLAVAGALIFGLYVVALHRLPSRRDAPTASATLVQEDLSVGVEGRALGETIEEKLDSFSALSLHPSPAGLNGIPGLSGTRVVRMAHAPMVESSSGERYQPADLVVWPESPSDFHTNDPVFQTSTSALAKTVGAPLDSR